MTRPVNKPLKKPLKKKEGFFARLNRAVTEVGIEHFDDDLDWDARVKLPGWQLARLKRRYEERKAARLPRIAKPPEAE
jgi:hypothetical protein